MKRLFATILLLSLLTMPALAVTTPEEDELSLTAPSAVLMERTTGTLLYEKNGHERMSPASVTKVMTLLLIAEQIESGALTKDDMVSASSHAASMDGSQIWLEEGEVLTVAEMLKCVAVVSANDCAVALGEHLAGSEEAFVQMMNARAQELGMKDTRFVNACGLTAEGHVTSAHDIGLMSAQLLREHRWITDYTLIWQDYIREGTSVLNNTNKMLKSYQGITGLKTGFTTTAGYCISATAEREGLHLIAVVMGGETKESRNGDAAALLNWGFANYAAVTLTADRPLLPVPVEMGRQQWVEVELGQQTPLVLERASLGTLEKTVELPEQVHAPVEQGQELGCLVVRQGGAEVCRVPIVACGSVERLGLWDVFQRVLMCACGRADEEAGGN